MEKPLSLPEKLLFFVDASTYKLSNDKNSVRPKQATFMGYFWWNIVYWPLRWLKIGHHINLYILATIAIIEIVMQIGYPDKISEMGENYYNFYSRAIYIIFAVIMIAFTLWNIYYMFSNV